MIHCCGSSSWAFEDFIEMGIRAVDTLQPEAADMDPACLARKYGGRLAFHGCISTAKLAVMTPEAVAQNVAETLETMMPHHGYCLAPTHYLQDNTPVENVIAAYVNRSHSERTVFYQAADGVHMHFDRILGDGKLRDEGEYSEAMASREALLEEMGYESVDSFEKDMIRIR